MRFGESNNCDFSTISAGGILADFEHKQLIQKAMKMTQPPSFLLYYSKSCEAFIKHCTKPGFAGCDSLIGNHTPLVQATDIVALFAASGALPLFQNHRSRSSAPYSRSKMNVIPGVSQRGTDGGMK